MYIFLICSLVISPNPLRYQYPALWTTVLSASSSARSAQGAVLVTSAPVSLYSAPAAIYAQCIGSPDGVAGIAPIIEKNASLLMGGRALIIAARSSTRVDLFCLLSTLLRIKSISSPLNLLVYCILFLF